MAKYTRMEGASCLEQNRLTSIRIDDDEIVGAAGIVGSATGPIQCARCGAVVIREGRRAACRILRQYDSDIRVVVTV